MSDVITYASDHLPEVIAAGAGSAAALTLATVGIRRLIKSSARRSIAATCAAVGAVLCTALTTNTSWRFFGTNLHVTNIPERALMFAVLEVGLFACTMAARENLNNEEKGAPGLPGIVVWLLAGFAAIPAYSVGGDLIAGTVRTVLGPVMAVFLVHLALGMELRHRNPGAQSKSVLATVGRALQQRALARLGLGVADLTAQEIAQDRAVAKAAVLSDRISAIAEDSRGGRYGQWLTGRLRRQLRRAGVADDPARADALLAHLAVTRHALALSAIELPSPWTTRQPLEPATASPDVTRSADGSIITRYPDGAIRTESADGSIHGQSWTEPESSTEPAPGSAPEAETIKSDEPAGASVTYLDSARRIPEAARIPAQVSAPAESVPEVRNEATEIVSASVDGPESGSEIAEIPGQGRRRKVSVLDVTRQAYRDSADTQTLRKIIAEALPEAQPETINRSIRLVRKEREAGNPPSAGTGQYL